MAPFILFVARAFHRKIPAAPFRSSLSVDHLSLGSAPGALAVKMWGVFATKLPDTPTYSVSKRRIRQHMPVPVHVAVAYHFKKLLSSLSPSWR
jgi:hypothetical protein